jgi:hypothetical protein
VRHRIQERDVAPMRRDRVARLIGPTGSHRDRQILRRVPQTQRMRAGGDIAVVGDASAENVVDEAALGLMPKPGAVLFDHPVHHQGGRGSFEDHLGPGGIGGMPRNHQPPPGL